MDPEPKLDASITEHAWINPGYAIAYALLRLADAQQALAVQVKYLGGGDAVATMGAIEFLAVSIKEGMVGLGDSLGDVAERLADIGDSVDAVESALVRAHAESAHDPD